MGVLDDIAAKRSQHRRLKGELVKVDADLAALICKAFDLGFTGPEIAAAANVSKPRVYQIRDQK